MSSHLKFCVSTILLLGSVVFTSPCLADNAAPAPDAVTSEIPTATPEDQKEAVAPEAEAPKEANPTTFKPAKRETDGGKLFLISYMVFWLLPLYLLWITSRRVRRLEDDLTDLRALLPDDASPKA
jgi:hypothetical protein